MYRSVALALPTLSNHIHSTACPSSCPDQKPLNFCTRTAPKVSFQLCPPLKDGNEPCPPILESIIRANLARHYVTRGCKGRKGQPALWAKWYNNICSALGCFKAKPLKLARCLTPPSFLLPLCPAPWHPWLQAIQLPEDKIRYK